MRLVVFFPYQRGRTEIMDKIITLQDFYNELLENASALWVQGKSVGHDPQLILHWSAGRWNQIFHDYHVNITGSGILHKTLDFSNIATATYKHNTGSFAISLCCAYGADTNNLGDYPPTNRQIETMARMIAIFSNVVNVPIDKSHILTHGEVGDNEDGTNYYDPYGPRSTCERWDNEFLGTPESPSFNPWSTDGSRGGDVLRGKGIYYQIHGNVF